ncbi:D-alanyl-D-alanine carboxypeptidase [bacterium]|nr:D-alanyl-D-alanine carboxypeptidase [bacterium]
MPNNHKKLKTTSTVFIFLGLFLMGLSFGFNSYFLQRTIQQKSAEPLTVLEPKKIDSDKPQGDKTDYLNREFSVSSAFTSKSYLIYDKNSSQILYGKDIDTQLPNASTTKLMTAYLAFNTYSLDTVLAVPAECVTLEGSNVGFKAGERFYVEDLFYGLMLRSGSDAACVLAANFPGGRQEFIKEMNNQATDIKLKNTFYKNEIGLDEPGHFSSSKDLLILIKKVLEIEKLKIIMGTRSYVLRSLDGQNYAINNTNSLLFDLPGTVGYKTGYTSNAGECLVFGYENLGNKLIVIVMGSNDRFADVKELLNGYLQTL